MDVRTTGVPTAARERLTAIWRSLPPRFQRQRTRGWKMPPGGACCTRPGPWGNPFVGVDAAYWFGRWCLWYVRGQGYHYATLSNLIEEALCRGQELSFYRRSPWGLITPTHRWFQHLGELRGRPLGCFCAAGDLCHVDALRVVANAALCQGQEAALLADLYPIPKPRPRAARSVR